MSDTTQTTPVESPKTPEAPKVPPDLTSLPATDVIISRNGFDLVFTKVEGKREVTGKDGVKRKLSFLSSDFSKLKLTEVTTWLGDKVTLAWLQAKLDQAAQNLTAACFSDKDGKFSLPNFVKGCTQLDVRGMSAAEIQDELLALGKSIATAKPEEIPSLMARFTELMEQFQSKKRAKDTDSTE